MRGIPKPSAGSLSHVIARRDPRASRVQDRLARFGPSRISRDPASGRYRVDANGDGTTDFEFSNPDFNTKSFNANVVFRWEYRPGSTLYLVWTQRREGETGDGAFRLGRDFTRIFDAAATNVVLVKASYRLVR